MAVVLEICVLHASKNETMEFLKDLLQFLWERKIWWLMPVILVLLAFGVLWILSAVSPAASTFIYTLF